VNAFATPGERTSSGNNEGTALSQAIEQGAMNIDAQDQPVVEPYGPTEVPVINMMADEGAKSLTSSAGTITVDGSHMKPTNSHFFKDTGYDKIYYNGSMKVGTDNGGPYNTGTKTFNSITNPSVGFSGGPVGPAPSNKNAANPNPSAGMGGTSNGRGKGGSGTVVRPDATVQ
jgi:hypothetical protein